MNNTKQRLITLLLALVMIFTSVPLNAFAASEANSGRKEITDIKTVGDKEIINLGEVKGQKSQLRFFSGRQRLFGATTQQAGSTNDTVAQKVEISLTTMGLNLEEEQFDPSALTEVGSFDVEITFKELGGKRTETRTMTFQAGETKKTETFYLPKDLGNGNVEAEIPKLKDNIALRVYVGAHDTTNYKLGETMTYAFELTQIIHPVIDLKVVDPYGKELQENINQALGLKLALEDEHDFTLAANTKTFNIRTLADFAGDNIAELNEVGANPTLSLTTQLDANKRLTVDSKTYKLNKITYNALGQEVEINGQKQKVGGYIEFATQPKIIVPTPDDNGNLPKTPDGYKRLSFHAESSPNAQDGRFKNGEKLKVIDVLEGTEYTDQDLQKQIKEIGQPTPIINGRVDDNKKFLKWKPELPTTGTVADTDYYPVYLANGDKITPGEKLPDGVFEVKVVKDDTIAADVLYGKTYAVFDGSTLARNKFPDLVAAVGHQNPKWTATIEGQTVDEAKPWTKEIHKATTFKATAAKDAATQIGKDGLKAVDTTALQGQDLTEAFWHKGVELADNTPADKKDAFAALLKDATVTDLSNRTSTKVEDQVGKLLVTFKDGSTLEVENQKLIVKPNTVTVAFDKAEGQENPLRDGDTTVKGKITASSNSDKFPVSLDGAVVTIKKGDTVLTRTLANADGSFVAGVKDPLVAGEEISVVVTLPESKTESAPVTEKVQLNPDKLNSIIPTGNKVVGNLEGKKGVDQEKVKKLKEAIQKAYDELVDKAPEGKKQENQKVKSTVTVDPDGQKSLNDQYETIKKAIEAITGNTAPKIEGTSHKEIFKGDALNLEEGITVTDKDSTEKVSDIVQFDNKDFTYKVEKIEKDTRTEITKDKHAEINQTPGTYVVTYTAKDKSGAEGTFIMTLVVKKDVIEVPGEFPDPIPEGYVKVEFKSGDHAGLKGTSKFLVKEGGAKSLITEPEIVPVEGWKVNDPKWTVEIPETFATNFETTANMLEVVRKTEPKEDDKDKYATVEFKPGDHGTFEKVDQLEQTTKFWVLKGEQVIFNVPTVTEADNYKFTGWDKKVQASYDADTTHTATYKEKVVTKDPGDKTNYAKLTFEKGDHGKFEANAQTTIWVLKDTEVKFNAPTPTADKDFTFDKWDPALQTKYTEDKTHTAKYTSDKNVSDVPVEGFQEVKFVSGTDGNFGKDNEEKLVTEKSVWVRPDTLVDITDKAPQVTVTNDKKAFTGWSQKLIAEFAKKETATEIKAVYKDKVVTENPNDKDYAEIKFDAGKNGTFEKQDEKTTFWVLKGQQVTDDFKAPTIKANDGYTFKAWDPKVQKSYDKDQTHTATYKTNNSISDTKVDGFQEVKFLPGTDGKFEGEKQEKSVWVEPGVLVDLRAKAPKVIANDGKVHTGWDKDLVAKFQLEFGEDNQPKATEITAQYKDKVVTKDPKDKNYVTVEFKAGDHGKFEQVGEPKKDQTTKFWVLKGEEVTFNAPTVTPEDKYSFIGWKEPIKTVYSENTTHTAQYSNTISDKYVEGWTEITFNSGDHGRFVADAKTVKWVDPKADIKLSDMAPGITPDINYSFKAWTKPGEDAKANPVEVALDSKAKYDKPVTFTATYESDISNTEKTGFVKVTFAPGNDGKFVEGSVTEVYVRSGKDVDLREKAPKVMPNTGYGHTGWDKDLAKVNVTEETTITATYTKGEFDAKNITSFDILGPKKAAYAEGDKLDLTGFTVVAIDKAGIRKEYTVKDNALKDAKDKELTGVTLKVGETTIDLANLPDLTNKAHDDKPITLTKDGKDYNSTVHLSVSMTRTNQPTDLVAANQGENPTETKIKGKAQKGDTVKIYVPGQKDPIKTVEVTNEDGSFETSVKTNENKPYPVGTKFNVTATGKDKEESSPQEVKVIKDVNGDWEDDGEGQKTPTPTAKALNQGANPTSTTITGKAEKGAKVVAKVGDTVVGETTADPQTGEYKIEAKKNNAALPKDTEVKVTAQVEGKLVSDPTATVVKIDKDGNGVDDDKEKFNIKKATKVEIIKNPDKMNYLVKTTDGKAKFETKGLVVKFTDDAGKSATYTAEELAKMNDVTINPANNEEIGLTPEGKTNKMDLTVTVTGAEAADKPTVKADKQVVVQLDADGNKIADEDEQTPEPDVTARNIGTDGPDGKKVPATKTTVEMETQPKAKVIIEYKDANNEDKKIETTAGEDGKLTKEIEPKLKEGTDVKVTVQDGEKQPADKTVKVFEDLDNNKIPDTQAGQTERPAAIASNKGNDPKFTTIKVKAEKGSVITVKAYKVEKKENEIVRIELGNVVLENNEAKSDNLFDVKATFEGKPLPSGTEILVYAENKPKTISEPQTTTVFNDTNNDGKPDGGKVDLNKIQDIQVIDPNKMTYVEGTDGQLNLAGLKVVVRDTAEGIQIFEYDTTTNKFKDGDTVVDGFTVKVEDKTVEQNTVLTSAEYNNKKITVAYGEKTGQTVQALKVTKTLPAPEVDPVKKGDTDVKVKVPTNGETKITVKVGDKEVVAEKDPQDGQWKVGNNPIDTVKGKLEIPVDPLKQGDVVKVTTEDAAGNKGETEKQVPVDEYSKDPTDVKAKNDPATPNKTTITGKATPGATITITDKDGNVLTTEPTPITAGEDGTFKATIDKKDPNTLLLVTSKEDGKEPSADVPVQVEGSSDVVEKKPGETKPEGFVEVRFVIKDADNKKGSLEGAKEFYVNPKVEVALNPPTVKLATGYKLSGWDKDGQMTIPAKYYTEADATETDKDGSKYVKITAIFAEEKDTVEAKPGVEKPAGYKEVTFAVDTTKAKFNDNAVTKYYVNPNKDIKLTAPGVTVTDPTYTFEGWDNGNWNGQEFNVAKYETDTLITAKLKGSTVATPQVGDVTTGDTKVDVNPGTADKVTVVVEGQGTVVVTKDPQTGTWTKPDGTVVTPDGTGNLPIPVQPIGEKALVEVTVEKDGVVSEKVAKTAQKILVVVANSLKLNDEGITVKTLPAGAKVTIKKAGVVVGEGYTGALGSITIGLKDSNGDPISIKEGDSFEILAEMDGYISKKISAGLQQVIN